MNPFNENIDDLTKFDVSNEETMKALAESITNKANYDLRQIIGITQRFKERVSTGKTGEYGEEIQDWNKVDTKDLINFYAEGSAWCFYSTPIKMQAFIESSLADIIYRDEYNKAFTDPSAGKSQGVRAAFAEQDTLQSKFVVTYRKMYTEYVTETLKTFDALMRRMERVINMRQAEERANPSNPFVR